MMPQLIRFISIPFQELAPFVQPVVWQQLPVWRWAAVVVLGTHLTGLLNEVKFTSTWNSYLPLVLLENTSLWCRACSTDRPGRVYIKNSHNRPTGTVGTTSPALLNPDTRSPYPNDYRPDRNGSRCRQRAHTFGGRCRLL
ncbi:hypothetical protein SAMN06269250_5230 [Spirosoma fluviale]|uniref:Uncharacterized protein n=1 Tax=Spirosoma fluviale TaxID=1597977 RepID=A0A286GL74_9BACT|nr:hypothetical protein SAMN06269250_5230 [Spirosoma fluviale]